MQTYLTLFPQEQHHAHAPKNNNKSILSQSRQVGTWSEFRR